MEINYSKQKGIRVWDGNNVVFELEEKDRELDEVYKFFFVSNYETLKEKTLEREVAFLEEDGKIKMMFKLPGGELVELASGDIKND